MIDYYGYDYYGDGADYYFDYDIYEYGDGESDEDYLHHLGDNEYG